MTDATEFTDPFEYYFWNDYPRREETPRIEGKKKCRAKLEGMVAKGEVTWEVVHDGVLQYAQCDRVKEGTFIKMPITFINNDAWDDEYDTPVDPFKDAHATKPHERTLDQWRIVLGEPSEFNRDWRLNNWSADNGPPPGEPGCQVPNEIIIEYGWIRQVTGEV